MKYLVIVESPAKTKKIQGFLNSIKNHTFIVDASFGHIRYFSKGLKSIDTNNKFNPTYSIISTKNKVVKNLKEQQKKVDDVIIATDLDREGEAIGFHVANVLNLNIENTKRICFNEITQKAVVEAFNNSRKLDYNLFNAQQARSILDLLIGFEISPLLWKSIQPKLSAGRCQSPALRLIYDREELINNFESNKSYQISSDFIISDNKILTFFNKTIEKKDKLLEILPEIVNQEYKLDSITEKKNTHAPPSPYITSSIQQDASNKFSMSPKLTMSVLQSLYEKGKITYMRTDSVAISDDFIKQIKQYCDDNQLSEYYKETKYKGKVANAQEAHECIRPVSLNDNVDNLEPNEQKLYKIIKNRTIASQLKKYIEKEFIYKLISTDNIEFIFTFSLKNIITLGYKIIYEQNIVDDKELIDIIEKGGLYKPEIVFAKEKNTKPKPRYTEASLVKELEDKGIGRPSTFSSIVSKVLERKYVHKETKQNIKEIDIETFEIKPGKEVLIGKNKVKSQSEKNKLFITDIGKVVCEFMNNNFSQINSYTFTSNVETDLDKISNNEKIWHEVIDLVYQDFHKKVIELSKDTNIKQQKDKLQNLIGVNPENNKNIYSYIGKFGPCIQEGERNDNPKYVSISKDDEIDINKISLEEALGYLKYPLNLGNHDSEIVYIKKGKFGFYIECGKKRVSLDNSDINLENAIQKLKEIKTNIIKEFSNLKIMNGKFGPYIRKGTQNVSIPKDKEPEKLTKKECEEIIKNHKPKKFQKKKKLNT
uniref:DNA topoisomerase n=1 Tax=viral metagenome TaxID=1070528 RepID=A0A6C0JF09_9ZZZZ